jgi:hypothetical protein
MLFSARYAPSGPNIQHPYLALHILRPKLGRIGIKRVQGKSRRRLADQGRWDFFRVAIQTNRQKNDEAQKKSQGN